MSLEEQLASRLRQSIQGCTSHIHGPVQAWHAISEAVLNDNITTRDVAQIAIDACSRRIKELTENGVQNNDIRIKKEELTSDFIKKLLL
jgi:hypothetical protein